MHRVACVSRALAGRRGPYKKFTETTGRFLSASSFFFLSTTYSSFEFATIQEFFNAGGKIEERREKEVERRVFRI